MEHIKEVLDRFKDLYLLKTVFLFEEGCRYCGISPSKMYKHTSANNIPYYKPEGKLIYFKREELDEWLLRNRQSTNEEMQRTATSLSLKRNSSKSKKH
ncbi:helix-turn-helix domain-containing protein [Gelidibacter japonicus]|uniref:helix-turn-helix domain-containing protein n=1 Tax=Gelidibacter japonicus TaxID=1962232 RepID=UPI003A92C377